ncbi:MAG: DUF1330 domain-containing protein [Gammaproteobacteria bacterium]|nr:DUF1330 domain-containing protein [Gammaproteobacteria bacterium]
MTGSIHPRPENLAALADTVDACQAIVMINLLKFRVHADYPDGTRCSGREAYATYAQQAYKKVREAGGEVLYSGTVHGAVIAPPDEDWDAVILVRYPTLEAFRTMIDNADYQRIARHRTAALADSRLLLSQVTDE